MHPLLMSALISGGINALQGKRGSNLLKSTVMDTAMSAALMGGTNLAMGQPANPLKANFQFMGMNAPVGATPDRFIGPAEKGFMIEGSPGRSPSFSESITSFTDVFKDKPGGKYDPGKVGIGAGAGALGLLGLGAFDPKPPEKPKIPGYNKFYAADPSMFMPYDDPDIDPIDYSKYPDEPYSNMNQGGIASFDDGGPVKNINLDPAELFKKIMMEGYRPTPEERDALDKYLADQENKKGGGIMQLAAGGRASNQPIESIEETTIDEEEPTPPPQGLPRIPFQDPNMPMPTPMPGMGGLLGGVMAMKTGALVDKLPSMSNTDENNPKNYKRTSGKLVVDAAGKGNEEKDTMLAQLADGEFVTKSKAVRGAGIALGASPKNKKQQRELGARFFYKQMADFDKLAKRMAS